MHNKVNQLGSFTALFGLCKSLCSILHNPNNAVNARLSTTLCFSGDIVEYEEAFSLYKLNNLEPQKLVSLADEWLGKSVYTESLDELYTMKNPIMVDVGPLFEKAMIELKVKEPSRIEAANNIIRIVLNRIISNEVKAEEGASFLYWKVHHEITDKYPDKKYLGDNLGLQGIFCWLREIWDCRDGSMILYHTDLSREEAEMKFHEHLIEEAEKWINAVT